MARITNAQVIERSDSLKALRDILKPGDTVHTILRHTSRSGMQRSISLVIVNGADVRELDYLAARVMGDKIDNKRGGIKVSGCGMDMGFHLVYNLGRYLWPDGFGLPMTHPENERPTAPDSFGMSVMLSRCGWKSNGRNGNATGWDSDGGYALKHRWL